MRNLSKKLSLPSERQRNGERDEDTHAACVKRPRTHAQFHDVARELVRVLMRVHVLQLLSLALKEPNLARQVGPNVVIEQELGEAEELATQELVRERHRGVHHTGAVRANGGGDALDVHHVEMLRTTVGTLLDEQLQHQVMIMHRSVEGATTACC